MNNLAARRAYRLVTSPARTAPPQLITADAMLRGEKSPTLLLLNR